MDYFSYVMGELMLPRAWEEKVTIYNLCKTSMQVLLSISEKTYNPATATHFTNVAVQTAGLHSYLINHCYSLLTWRVDETRAQTRYNRKRLIANFESASGVVADIDGGLAMDDAITRLKAHNLNYAIITTKSHGKVKGEHPAAERYHILLFFPKPVTEPEEYKQAFTTLALLFPEIDPATKDLARFMFPSPNDAEFFDWWEGDWFTDSSLPSCPPSAGSEGIKGSMSRPSRECVNVVEESNQAIQQYTNSIMQTQPEFLTGTQPPPNPLLLKEGEQQANHPLLTKWDIPLAGEGNEGRLRGRSERTKKNTTDTTTNKIFQFEPEQLITLATGEVVKTIEIEEKSPCRCIRAEHTDEHPSAFVQYVAEKGKQMLYCSGCGYTGWCTVTLFEYHLARHLEGFYFLGKDILEFGVKQHKFFEKKLSPQAFYVLIGAQSKEEQKKAFEYLVLNKRLQHLSRIDYAANPLINETTYTVSAASGEIEVNVAPLAADVEDNEFIEQYLEQTFGDYTLFIKEYLAMYAYTNYIHLPTLILYGARGTSKTTFANMVADMYPSLYMDWTGSVAAFTPEAEKKLLIVEENISDDKAQYKMLKKYTGQPFLFVNKKFYEGYHTRNNINLILLSNEHIPVYVEKTEMPVDEKNNQFFVYEFPVLTTEPDALFQQKLRERLGHYLRTELQKVFHIIDRNYSRYGISVPITEFEKRLFENNTTNVETTADQIMEKIENGIPPQPRSENLTDAYHDGMQLYKSGWLSVALLTEYARKDIHANTIIKSLKKRKVIGEERERIMLKGKRYASYKITSKINHGSHPFSQQSF